MSAPRRFATDAVILSYSVLGYGALSWIGRLMVFISGGGNCWDILDLSRVTAFSACSVSFGKTAVIMSSLRLLLWHMMIQVGVGWWFLDQAGYVVGARCGRLCRAPAVSRPSLRRGLTRFVTGFMPDPAALFMSPPAFFGAGLVFGAFCVRAWRFLFIGSWRSCVARRHRRLWLGL